MKKNIFFPQCKKRKGFIALFAVLALLVFSLSFTLGVTYLSIGGGQEGLAIAQSAGARALVDGCAEDALLRSIRDENYTGEEQDLLGGVCTVSIQKDGTTWTMSVSGTQNEYTRSLEIVFEYTLGPPNTLMLTSWQEQ